MSKVLVISADQRVGSNSLLLAEKFAEGAKEAGNETELVSLRGKKINYCLGCLSCQTMGKCVQNDDAVAIVAKMKEADIICFASPIYYYEMSGSLKVLLDRSNPLYPGTYKFRKIYAIFTSNDSDFAATKRPVEGLGGWIECYPKCHLEKVLHAGGINHADEIKNNPAKLDEAFQMGLSIR